MYNHGGEPSIPHLQKKQDMKKISLYILALLTMGFAACNEDFETTTSPQSNPQESILQIGDVQFTPATVTSLNLADLIENGDKPIVLGTVTVKEGFVMPSDMKLTAVVQMDVASNFSDAVDIEAESLDNSKDVCIIPSKLQEAYVKNFGRDPNDTTLYMRTNVYTATGDESMACISDPTVPAGAYTIAFTPVDEVGVKISREYFAVLRDKNGNYSPIDKKKKCTRNKYPDKKDKKKQVEKNVYDDPEFKAEIKTFRDENAQPEDTYFAFVGVEDTAEFNKGNLDVLVELTQVGDTKLETDGKFFKGPASEGADRFEITLNMEDRTIQIKSVILRYCYYLLPMPKSKMKIEAPDSCENYMFYCTGQEQTTYKFNYTTFWPNNENGDPKYNIVIWDREAMRKNDTGSKWGAKTRETSGSLFYKQGTYFGPMAEGWYTLNVTIDETKTDKSKYEWIAISEPTTNYTDISIIGATEAKLTKCVKAPHNWSLLQYTLTEDSELKFRANDGTEWGGDGSKVLNKKEYSMPIGNEKIKVPAGTYNIYLNDITGNWSIILAD